MSLFKGREEYWMAQDEFIRYITEEVNPARKSQGLSEIREHEARECFRLIDDFSAKWGYDA